jgi:hypothetical protein
MEPACPHAARFPVHRLHLNWLLSQVGAALSAAADIVCTVGDRMADSGGSRLFFGVGTPSALSSEQMLGTEEVSIMMTLPLDMTSELAAIPYGLAIALTVSLLGILTQVCREEIQVSMRSLVAACHRTRSALHCRRLRVLSGFPTASGAR